MIVVFSLDWCEWAGIKRVFYWNEADGIFVCVKVNEVEEGQYETQADIRLGVGNLKVGHLSVVDIRVTVDRKLHQGRVI